jgi:hypothetical protein
VRRHYVDLSRGAIPFTADMTDSMFMGLPIGVEVEIPDPEEKPSEAPVPEPEAEAHPADAGLAGRALTADEIQIARATFDQQQLDAAQQLAEAPAREYSFRVADLARARAEGAGSEVIATKEAALAAAKATRYAQLSAQLLEARKAKDVHRVSDLNNLLDALGVAAGEVAPEPVTPEPAKRQKKPSAPSDSTAPQPPRYSAE